MGQLCQSVQPPNAVIKGYVIALKIITLLQVAVCALNFVCYQYFLREGIFGIFFILFLFLAFNKIAYQILMIYIFFSSYFVILYLIILCTPIQRGQKFSQFLDQNTFCYIVGLASCTYYIFTSIFCFFPYRHFKRYAFNKNPILKKYFAGQSQAPLSEHRRQITNYQVEYGDIQQKKIKSKEKGTFHILKGQGMVIQ